MSLAPRSPLGIATLGVGFIGLVVLRAYSYLLFHTSAELFSILIAGSIFLIAWNVRAVADNDYLLFMGIAAGVVAGVDVAHMLAYAGMPIFTGYGANLPTQLWIIARAVQAATLAIAPRYLTRPLPVAPVGGLLLLLTAGLVAAAFAGWFPVCFIEGVGLTPFKRGAEYVICGLLGLALYRLYRRRAQFDPAIYRLLAASILVTIGAEVAFTWYRDVYGYWNLLGHYFKVVAFYLIYKAIVEAGLRRPYALLFRDLTQREQALRQALQEVKTLRGILPICVACKRIRDDQGYWQQVEVYIRDRTDVDFSHALCPPCMAQLYPEFAQADSEPTGAGRQGPPADALPASQPASDRRR